ncbi:unnamed protein product, partial [Candidula unifasciata]
NIFNVNFCNFNFLYRTGICNPQCGFLAVCQNATCTCSEANYVLHNNGRDCRNVSCSIDDCLQCDNTNTCIRCEAFLSASGGQCIQKCKGSAELKGDILTCSESKDDGVDIVVAVVSGIAAGAVVCIIVIIAVCIYIRKTRRNVNLQSKNYDNRQIESGHLKQFPAYDNKAYETDNQTTYGPVKIDPLEYANNLDKLRPHSETLMELLSQVRSKTRAMDASDERVPTYKGVIHQLCRVLVLIHKRDPVVSIPSDALGLIQWAHQMLEDHKEQQNSSNGDLPDFPLAQISCVDLDFDNPGHPVYATPERSQLHDSSASSVQGMATPYSTVPIPVLESDQQHHHYGTGKRPGFATISRARAKPNSDFIRALEAELNSTDSVSVSKEPVAASQQPNSGFRREDFQNFLIHSAEKSDLRNAFNHSTERSQQTSSRPLIIKKQSSELNLNSELKEKLKNRINKPEAKSHLILSAQKLQSNQAKEDLTIGSQQSAKKNIITNPNLVKKSNSQSSKHSKYATPNYGYFANGHYYDPNPMPHLEAEVYAPGSSYSGHSNAMSTFLGDLPRSRSASSSDQSEDRDDDSENSGGDLDVFPFDPEDCTEPVEV